MFWPICEPHLFPLLLSLSGFAKIAEIDPTDTVAEVVQIGLLAGAIRRGYNRRCCRRLGDLPVQTSARLSQVNDSAEGCSYIL